MIFSNDRQQLRDFYFNVWRKHKNQQPLEPLETQLLRIMLKHPEYHSLFDEPDKHRDQDYFAELGQTNPFLHMGLHVAIQEQIEIDRPSGIAQIYQQLCHKLHDPHTAEHEMMSCLTEYLWQLQQQPAQQSPADESAYLACLRSLVTT